MIGASWLPALEGVVLSVQYLLVAVIGFLDPLGASLRLPSLLQVGIPAVVRDALQNAPPPDTVTGLLLYGGGGALGMGGGKKLLDRVRSKSTPTTVEATATSVSTTTSGGTPASIKHDETAFTMPSFLPVSKGIRKVSHNEIHAIEIGLVVGFVTVWLYSIGRTQVAGAIVVVLIAGGLGFRRYRTKAVATVRMEPWYAFIAFAIGALAGWLFFSGPIALP